MRIAQYDYHPAATAAGDVMRSWWSDHWASRVESYRDRDMGSEEHWRIIEDVVDCSGRLLEAGAGLAHSVRFFDSLGYVSVGVDYATAALSAAKHITPSLRLLGGDLRSLPFVDGSFDVVYSNGAIEHDERGPDAALREFHRVLRTGGCLLCSVPCLNVEKTMLLPVLLARDWLKRNWLLRSVARKTDPFDFYQYMFSPATYRRVLEQAGFVMKDLRPYDAPARRRLPKAIVRACLGQSQFYDPHMMMAICTKPG